MAGFGENGVETARLAAPLPSVAGGWERAGSTQAAGIRRARARRQARFGGPDFWREEGGAVGHVSPKAAALGAGRRFP